VVGDPDILCGIDGDGDGIIDATGDEVADGNRGVAGGVGDGFGDGTLEVAATEVVGDPEIPGGVGSDAGGLATADGVDE